MPGFGVHDRLPQRPGALGARQPEPLGEGDGVERLVQMAIRFCFGAAHRKSARRNVGKREANIFQGNIQGGARSRSLSHTLCGCSIRSQYRRVTGAVFSGRARRRGACRVFSGGVSVWSGVFVRAVATVSRIRGHGILGTVGDDWPRSGGRAVISLIVQEQPDSAAKH